MTVFGLNGSSIPIAAGPVSVNQILPLAETASPGFLALAVSVMIVLGQAAAIPETQVQGAAYGRSAGRWACRYSRMRSNAARPPWCDL